MIDEIQTFIAVDEELGLWLRTGGGGYDELYERIWKLEEKLAHLSHYRARRR